MPKRVLIVDDEPSIRRVLAAHLERDGYEVETAANGQEAIATLQASVVHAVVTDMKMPGMSGLELLEWVKDHDPGLPVIVITAHGTVDSAVEAIKLGAHDYVTKPFDRDELKLVIEKAIRTEEAGTRELAPELGRFDIIGRTPSMMRIYDLISRVAASPTTVLITGESGTGKELVARALHDQSDRKDCPFVSVNCGAIPEALFESELFGHEKGAFTGAATARPGRFELADGGTLFLDEVGELPPDLQVKLLRVLQDHTFERVGGVKTLKVSVRLIAATNRNLASEVREGRFRQDLYYRLAVVPIALPPLRTRAEDIPLLVEHFLARFNHRLGRSVRRVDPEAMAALQALSWPGNIRELENLMERLVLLCDGEVLTLADLPEELGDWDADDEDHVRVSETAPPADDPATDRLGLKEYVRVHTVRLERDRILQVLRSESYNVTRAARRLGISRKSLQVKMRDYGLREAD